MVSKNLSIAILVLVGVPQEWIAGPVLLLLSPCCLRIFRNRLLCFESGIVALVRSVQLLMV